MYKRQAQTITLDYNDLSQVEAIFKTHGEQIAAIIVEPIAGNMNFVVPTPAFLTGLRAVCDQYNSLLIFDEVMTGFRVALGGAQEYFNIKPDLTTLGKVIGAGMPVGAFGGRRDIMQKIAPTGPVYQAGTLSGNPIAMYAGLTQLNLLSQPGFYKSLNKKTQALVTGLKAVAKDVDIAFSAHAVGGMFGFLFSVENRISRFQQVTESNIDHFRRFYHSMLQHGIYFAPSAYEAGFVSAAHNETTLTRTLEAAQIAMQSLTSWYHRSISIHCKQLIWGTSWQHPDSGQKSCCAWIDSAIVKATC